jgi:polysaccharide chain length determinant protein (PEP-CTERM system associated)
MLGHRILTVEDYLTILKRRWWIIAIPSLILPIVGFGVSFLIPPEYESQTLVLINQQKVPEEIVKPVVSEDLDSRLASMREQILSRASLEPIIKKYNLYESSRDDLDARIQLARKAILIQPIPSATRSNGLPGFKIFFKASDPQTAQQVCQEITSLFTSANTRIRHEAAQGTTDFLRQQVAGAKQNLDNLDQKLAVFKRQYAGMLPEDTTNNTNILTTLNSRLDAISTQLNSLQQNKTMAESMLAQQTQALAAQPGGSAARSPGAAEKELETLQAQEADLSVHYTDEYPALKRVRSRIAELQKQAAKEASAPVPVTPVPTPARLESASVQQLKTQMKIIDATIAAKHKEQEQVDAQIRGYQARIQSSPQIEEQEKELTRDYQTTLESYNTLKAKLDAATMGIELENTQQGETFSLLDAANLPESPTWPRRPLFGLGGLAAGLVLGLMIVALIEYRDTALRSERDVWAFTQLPTLAVIAYAEDAAAANGSSRFGRLFRRKTTKNQLADAPG